MGVQPRIEVVWQPRSYPQEALLACPVFEVFFGGARGSLKTDGVLGEWGAHAGKYGRDANGIMFRRSRTELIDTIERSKRIYGPIGAKFNEQEKTWRMSNDARFRFAYLENDADAEAYQGHSYTRVYIEEIGNFPTPAPVFKLLATLRSSVGVPVGMRSTGNPGGPGHQWVKARYIDPNPKGWEIVQSEFKNPFTGEMTTRDRVFIPGRITDHNLLGSDYIAQLQMTGSTNLVKAWLEGDWSVIEGAYFDNWSTDLHVIDPFAIPQHWTRFTSFDWGSAKPFSVGWWAVSDGDPLPKGALVRYREWYGASSPNVGLKLDAEQVAEGILDREEEAITYRVADPACWKVDGGPSIIERFINVGERRKRSLVFQKADNSRLNGWDQLRARLQGEVDHNGRRRPMIYFFETCRDSIRTLPALQHDDKKPEDVDSEGEDHAPDDIRYACMSRPYAKPKPVQEPMRGLSKMTMAEVWKLVPRTKQDARI